ncbi:hypothetical protein OG369_38845 [Streptomyces sp. NBC_01221]|uniref:hypothetical protein n=1 Tax=Streptomyces sp. NBC_01221 TaxID=2903782 RepID=UPI002250BA90|nr:hypothetical protein [Streptomyces sp. NBC_01221]MCX4791821.1 hypothetical protein [Streptomyces sp. NBC_01221]
MGREIYAELHHDGTTVLAVNLSWKALRDQALQEAPEGSLLLHQDFTRACCEDFTAVSLGLARRAGVDSALHLTAAIATSTGSAPLTPVVSELGGAFMSVPDHARRPHRIQPDTTSLSPPGGHTALHEAAQDLFTDLMNQFGLDPQL